MKFPLFVLLAFVALTPLASGLFESEILKTMEEFRKRMCHRIPKLGIPALDPFKISHLETSKDNKILVDFAASITNLTIVGLSDFDIKALTITITPLRRSSIEVILPLTSLDSLYKAKGSIARIVNLNGDGTAEGHIDNVRVAISWILRTIPSLSVRSLNIELSIGDLYVNIEELIDEPRVNDFVQAVINELGIELLNDLWLEAQKRGIVEYVEKLVNGLLSNYSISDIIGIITGGGGGTGGGIFDGVPPDCKDESISIADIVNVH